MLLQQIANDGTPIGNYIYIIHENDNNIENLTYILAKENILIQILTVCMNKINENLIKPKKKII